MKITECKYPGQILNMLRKSTVIISDENIALIKYFDNDLLKKEHTRYLLANKKFGPMCDYKDLKSLERALRKLGYSDAKDILRGANHEI